MGRVVEWVSGFAGQLRRESGAAEPEFKEIAVVAGRLSLPEAEDVEEHDSEWRDRRQCRRRERPEQHAEEHEQDDHRGEDSAGQILKETAFQPPCLSGGVLGAVRFREAQLVHWNAPTSTVEPSRPNAVKSAFTITGAPAMMSPPIIDNLPESVSPRRTAKPPPTTQMTPKMNPMSMTMPIALLAPWARPPAA